LYVRSFSERHINHLYVSTLRTVRIKAVLWAEVIRNPLSVDIRELTFVLLVQRHLSRVHMLSKKEDVVQLLHFEHLLKYCVAPVAVHLANHAR